MELITILIINYAHPLTETNLSIIEKLTEQSISRIQNINSQIQPEQDIVVQIETMIDHAGLTSEEWQTKPILINLPSLNYSAAIMLALLHGRMGYFPAILRLKPEPGIIPPRFEVAEILNLQEIREKARNKR